LDKQTIVIHPFDPGGGEDEPEAFARELVKTFGDSSNWTGMNLGFSLLLSPMQEKDEAMVLRIDKAFKVAQELKIRLLIHVNHEWLFGFFPAYDPQHGNLMIQTITGVKALGFNDYKRVDSSSEIIKHVEWKSWTEPYSNYHLFWGSESIQPPKVNYKSPYIRTLLTQKSVVIKEAIAQGLAKYMSEDNSLFLGIDLGWETSLDDNDSNEGLGPIGYRALIDSGYGPGQLNDQEVNEFLGKTAKEYVDFAASLYESIYIPKEKMFSHYLLLDRDKHFPGYRYERWVRNPSHLAKEQSMLIPGFSMYCTTNDCSEIKNELQSDAPGDWVVTESGPSLLPILINGFPELNIRPPRFMTLYAFGANIKNDGEMVKTISDLLRRAPPKPPEEVPGLAIGYIDGVGEGPNGTVGVGGWACVPKNALSIKIRIYAGGAANQGGTLIAETLADQVRDDAGVKSLCQTNFTKNGFAYLISPQDRLIHANKKIYVHGVSTDFGGSNEELKNSGKFSVIVPEEPPTIQPLVPGPAIGYIDGVGEGPNGTVGVGGWACVPKNALSIKIRIYAGGAANQGGTLIAETLADQVRDDAGVKSLCQTNFTKNGFAYLISPQDRLIHANKKIYVHGVSTDFGGSNEQLGHSGDFSVP
jgi:hypothetical protein